VKGGRSGFKWDEREYPARIPAFDVESGSCVSACKLRVVRCLRARLCVLRVVF